MSTKIYDAYVVEGLDFEELHKHLCKFRKFYIQECINLLTSVLKPGMSNFGELAELLLSLMRRHANIPLNFESCIIVIPYRGKIYLKFFCDWHIFNSRVFKKFFGKHFKDFHYQDQADRPKDIDSKVWKARRGVWNAVMRRGGPTFTEMGFTFLLVDESIIFRIVYGALMKRRKLDKVNENNENNV